MWRINIVKNHNFETLRCQSMYIEFYFLLFIVSLLPNQHWFGHWCILCYAAPSRKCSFTLLSVFSCYDFSGLLRSSFAQNNKCLSPAGAISISVRCYMGEKCVMRPLAVVGGKNRCVKGPRSVRKFWIILLWWWKIPHNHGDRFRILSSLWFFDRVTCLTVRLPSLGGNDANVSYL